MTPAELQLDENDPLRILQLSDCHLLEKPGQKLMGVDTELSFHQVLQHLRSHSLWPPDLILLTGDLVQDPFKDNYRRLLQTMDSLNIPWVCLPGNHDSLQLMETILCKKGSHCAKRISSPDWQIICLDSHKENTHRGHLRQQELDFLFQCLSNDPQRTALIALHHPPIAVGSAWMDTMKLDNGGEFLALVARFPQVKGIIFGHVHQVFTAHYGPIPLWSVPSTCFQFKPGSKDFALDRLPPGYRWLELYAGGRLETWVERLEHPPEGLDFLSVGY